MLIGDSGQNDPYVYVEAAREHPRQVRAIVILDVGDHMAERAQELVQWQAELDEEGIPFYFVADAKEAASVMVHHRMVKKKSSQRSLSKSWSAATASLTSTNRQHQIRAVDVEDG